MIVITIIYVIGSLSLGLIEYRSERQYRSTRIVAVVRALTQTLIWWIFAAVEAYRMYR